MVDRVSTSYKMFTSRTLRVRPCASVLRLNGSDFGKMIARARMRALHPDRRDRSTAPAAALYHADHPRRAGPPGRTRIRRRRLRRSVRAVHCSRAGHRHTWGLSTAGTEASRDSWSRSSSDGAVEAAGQRPGSLSCSAAVKNIRRYHTVTMLADAATAEASMNMTTIW